MQPLFIDDLDGSKTEGTARFRLDGREHEIDLNAEHAQALRDALARHVHAARRAPARGLDSTEVREWAKTQGIQMKDRGRVPSELVVRFKAATGSRDRDVLSPGQGASRTCRCEYLIGAHVYS